ncbi:AAA family ATPase [Baekduia sp. Peel2402]|uniref:AAA family ATPase n=1 Tax=Baekduia sp. Peel2402 TaxID=3458296 RepID=UPI00403E9EB0
MTSTLLEREAELTALRGPLPDIRDGRGRLLIVEAPAGRGKSTLLAALATEAPAAGLRVLHARGGELERAYAFGAIRQLFERAVAETDPDARATLLSGAAAPAAALVASGGAGASGAAAGPGVLHAVYWLATNLSLQQPLLIIVDDVHWVDEPSLEAIVYLARRLADVPIGVVVGLRPAEPGAPHHLLDALRAEPGAAAVSVPPLTVEAVAALVRAAVPTADDALCAACAEITAGNPFYLRELLASMNGDASAARAREVALPELGDRIARRVAAAGPDAVALAEAMAVLGDGARLAEAAAVAELDAVEAASVAAGLRRVEILSDEDPVAFAHPLVRRAVYDALTVAERERRHAAAARLLTARGAAPGAVAEHLVRLAPARSSEVVAGLRGAAAEAIGRGAPEAAAAALRRALEEDAPAPPRAELLLELGEIEMAARDLRALEHLTEAYELTEDPRGCARVAISLAALLAALGQWDRLIALVDEVLARLGDSHHELALEVEALRAGALSNDSELIELYDRDEARLETLARGPEWPARAIASVLAITWGGRGERSADLRALAEHALRDGALLRERGSGAWPVAQVLGGLIAADEDVLALEVIDEALVLGRAEGSLVGTALSTAFRSWIHVRRGDLVAAEADMQAVAAVELPPALQMEVASVYWFFNDVLGERASLDALVAPAALFEPRDEFARTAAGAMMVETRGRHRLQAGDRAAGIADLRAAAHPYRRLRFAPSRGTWRSTLALALGADAADERHSLAAEEVALAEASGLARPHGIALRTLALVDGGDEEVDRLRASVALLEGTRARLEHARSLVALGSALRRRGQRADAREPLAAALELAHRCGAEGTAAQAVEELRAAGARPRRPERTGVEALTASEARVARLIAGGRTNADAAQELFVSLKTIETHLTRIYAKLGLSGPGARRRLGGALDQG